MPETLTERENIVQRTDTLEARPGYSLVVFEKTRYGPKYVTTVESGELFRPRWFGLLPLHLLGLRKSYEAYRVTTAEQLKLRFENACKSLDGVHEFTLKITIRYCIREPELVVEHLDRDPLRQIRGEVEDLFVERARRLSWSVIKMGGEDFVRGIEGSPDDGSGAMHDCVEQVRRLAQRYGIDVFDLALDRVLPESEIKIELSEKEARERIFVKARGVVDRMIEVFEDALSRAGEGVSNLAELKRAIQEVLQIRDSLPMLVQPFRDSNSESAAAAPVQLQLPPRNSEDSVSGLLDEIGGHLGSIDPQFRWRLTSEALHLVAEALLDGEARTEDLDRYRNRLEHSLTDEDLPSLDRYQVTLLRRLIDTDTLKRQLRRTEQ